jgi:hypothetical protein
VEYEKVGNMPDFSVPADHPKNIFSSGCHNMMDAHLLDDDSPLKDLYYWLAIQQFVAAIADEPKLYPSADPCQPVNTKPSLA